MELGRQAEGGNVATQASVDDLMFPMVATRGSGSRVAIGRRFENRVLPKSSGGKIALGKNAHSGNVVTPTNVKNLLFPQ